MLQIAGHKTFRLYKNNVALPFPEESFQAQGFEPGDVMEEVALSAGDTFYIPRGFTHDACAREESEEPSLHLTLGLYPPLLRDVLHRIIDNLADTEVNLRRSINSADWQFDGISDELFDSVSQHLTSDKLNRALPEVMREFRDDIALAGLSSAHQAAALFSGTAVTGKAVSQSNERCLLLQQQRYLGHETLGDTLYCRTFGQVLEFHTPHRQRVENWLNSGEASTMQFTGTAESPLPGGDEVLKSLLDSGLGQLHPA